MTKKKTSRKEKMKKATKKSQYGFSVMSKGTRHIIAGYASYVMIDSDDQLVTREALTAGLQRFMSDPERRNIMFSHEGIQVGKAIDEFEGKTTHVDDTGLYMVAEIYQDIETAKDIWEGVLEGDYNAFSICFEPLVKEDHEKNDNSTWEEVHTINLLEASVCENPKNPLSRFEILSKSQNVEKTKKGKKMTEENEKLNGEQKEYDCECVDCGYKTTTDKHCKDIQCKECGGQMRRSSRPGPGKAEKSKTKADLDTDSIVTSINQELSKLKLLGAKLRAEDLNNLAGLVTNLRTDGQKAEGDEDPENPEDGDEDEKAFPFPKGAQASEGDRWPTVIARAIDDLYSKIGASDKSQKSSIDTVRKMKAEVIKKAAETDEAKANADAAKVDADKAKADADKAKADADLSAKNAAEAKDVASKDREILGEIQKDIKGVNETFGSFDDRLKALENQKEVKTKVSKEDLVKDYKGPNVRETQDGVEIIQEGET